jgi:hypothetical protein
MLVRRIPPLAVLVALSMSVACGDNGPDPLTLDDLVGTWRATQFVFTKQSDPSRFFDLIQNSGVVTIVIAANGTYSGQQSAFGVTETFSGTITVSGSFVSLTDDEDPGDPTDFAASLTGNTLTLATSDAEFDFDFDGTDEPASLTAVFQRD